MTATRLAPSTAACAHSRFSQASPIVGAILRLPQYINSDDRWRPSPIRLISAHENPPKENLRTIEGIASSHVLGSSAIHLEGACASSLGHLDVVCGPRQFQPRFFKQNIPAFPRNTIRPELCDACLASGALGYLANSRRSRAIEKYGRLGGRHARSSFLVPRLCLGTHCPLGSARQTSVNTIKASALRRPRRLTATRPGERVAPPIRRVAGVEQRESLDSCAECVALGCGAQTEDFTRGAIGPRPDSARS